MTAPAESSRLDHLDAVRAFALLLGIVFHASLSFLPFFIGWAVMDESTSPLVVAFMTISHSFRMETFFLIAGFFGHLTFHRMGGAAFVRSRFVRIVVPFLAGWFLLRPLIVSGWIMGAASMRGDVDVGAGLRGGFESLSTLPAGIFTGTHLWFLYYLAMITALALALRFAIVSIRPWQSRLVALADAVVAGVARSRLAVIGFAIPTVGALWFMQQWGMDTPDKTLRPHLPTLLVYGGGFVLGWLLHRQVDVLMRLSRRLVLHGLLAVAGAVGVLALTGFQTRFGHPQFDLIHFGCVASYAVMMWSLVFFTIGVFEQLVRRPHRLVRFVADSSYWMYLIHLPIVVWLQVAVAELPWHWSVKLTAIAIVTIGVSLLTYDLFVRSTILGQILNGRRRERVLFTTRTTRHASPSVVAAGRD